MKWKYVDDLIKQDGIFHIFASSDVLEVMSRFFKVVNSQVIAKGQFPEQKIMVKCRGNLNEK
ncbi:hypothetical protein AGMMS49573_06070 [Endomicrobiia bacterium]|uniref:hypothetical protein n=1 Tax=Endomicrobium trichonymphae TaxID=1408204 RepID=UPI000BBA9DBB|nr:hypothetical protein [Candidatus Endomicrobium trichonymphae]GHT16407.1 hypothetical protein AGMMS49573_06070 [Endomicrobiia bacterium]GHT24041.1 hypothetical protein AGMMS49953_05690 [Endomicrobiia bacterium]